VTAASAQPGIVGGEASVLLGRLIGFPLIWGIAWSLVLNTDATTRYPGERLVVGLVWGLVTLLVCLAAVGVMLAIVYFAVRQTFAHRFPPAPRLWLNSGKTRSWCAGQRVARRLRTPRYGRSMRTHCSSQSCDRAALTVKFFPQRCSLLKRWANCEAAPAAWANHVAAVYTGYVLRRRPTLVRVLATLALAAVVILNGGSRAWLLLPLAVGVFQAVSTYTQTQRTVASALPEGAVATVDFLDDRLVYRRPASVDEIRCDDCRSVHVLGDVVVVLRLKSSRFALLMPRPLLPDERLVQLS